MEKISKKDIKNVVDAVLTQALTKLEIAEPSKKTKKLVDSVSRKFAVQLKRDVKRKFKKERKAESRSKKKIAKEVKDIVKVS
jgi:RNase P subunit RPR2